MRPAPRAPALRRSARTQDAPGPPSVPGFSESKRPAPNRAEKMLIHADEILTPSRHAGLVSGVAILTPIAPPHFPVEQGGVRHKHALSRVALRQDRNPNDASRDPGASRTPWELRSAWSGAGVSRGCATAPR